MDKSLNVKGLMFDLDGTILDTRPAYIKAAKISLKAMGQRIPKDSKLLEIPKRLEQKKTIVDIVKTDESKFLEIYLRTFYDIAATETKPMPNVMETLEALSKNAKLAVITMRFMPKEKISTELRQHGLDSYFAHIVTALDTPRPKPSPESLIQAVAAMDVQMCKCAIVGDSVVDVSAGKAAGAKTISVLSGLYSYSELVEAKPDFILDDVTQLNMLLN